MGCGVRGCGGCSVCKLSAVANQTHIKMLGQGFHDWQQKLTAINVLSVKSPSERKNNEEGDVVREDSPWGVMAKADSTAAIICFIDIKGDGQGRHVERWQAHPLTLYAM